MKIPDALRCISICISLLIVNECVASDQVLNLDRGHLPSIPSKEEVEADLLRRSGMRMTLSDEGYQQWVRDFLRKEAEKDAAAKKAAETAKSVGTVQVRGQADRDQTKLRIDRAQLDKNENLGVLNILGRQPGIVYDGRGLSMLGLPSHYTRILVDGKPPTPGFRLSQLRARDIESIEITFGDDAEYAGQGMAGTINVTLRKRYTQRNDTLSVRSSVGAAHSHALSARSDRSGADGGLFAFLNIDRSMQEHNYYQVEYVEDSSTGTRTDERFRRSNSVSKRDFAQANVRRNIRLPDDSWLMLTIDGSTEKTNDFNNRCESCDSQSLDGATTTYSDLKTSRGNFSARHEKSLTSQWSIETYLRGSKWQTETDDKFAYQDTSMRIGSFKSKFDAYAAQADLDITYKIRPGREWKFGVTADNTHADGSSLWDGGLVAQVFPQRSSTAITQNRALYGKFTATLSPRWSVNAGARYTNRKNLIRYEQAGLRPIEYESSFLAPSLNLSYAAVNGDRWVFGLSKSSLDPQTNLLESNYSASQEEVNRPLSPWSRGNPLLQAEEATSLVVTHIRQWTPRFDTSITATHKIIDNPLSRIVVNEDGRWFSVPVNLDRADARTLAIGGKYVRKIGTSNPIELTVSNSYIGNWTRIRGVPTNLGLTDYRPFTATLGIDIAQERLRASFSFSHVKNNRVYAGINLIDEETDYNSASLNINWSLNSKWAFVSSLSIRPGPETIRTNIYQDADLRIVREGRSYPKFNLLTVGASYRFN